MIKITGLLISFSSATTATRVKNELTLNRFPAKVIQTPKHLSSSGCSYSVKTTLDALEAADKAADKIGVRIKKVYRFDGNDYVKYR